MLRSSMLALALLSLVPGGVSAGVNRWTSSGPDGGYVAVVVLDSQNPSILFANTYDGIYKSSDGAATWSPRTGIGAPPRQRGELRFHPLAISPSNPDVLYTDRLKSVDGGAN